MSEESVLSFRKLVSAMRTTEKEYWAHRDKKMLRQSIELEKRVDGIIMKKRNEVPLNSTVAKVSTGAICYEKVASVPNLSQAIRKLKDNGFWVVTSDGSGTTNYDEIDYKCPIALVVGSEGFGVSRLLVRDSDFVAKIPMVGHVNSLNASVATAVFLAQISSSRSH